MTQAQAVHEAQVTYQKYFRDLYGEDRPASGHHDDVQIDKDKVMRIVREKSLCAEEHRQEVETLKRQIEDSARDANMHYFPRDYIERVVTLNRISGEYKAAQEKLEEFARKLQSMTH